MALSTPLMPFLRPLGIPRLAIVRHFLRFSTSSHCAAQSKRTAPREDPNLIASRVASPTYPPPSMKSKPRPKISKSSRRTAHPPKERPYPTRQSSHNQPEKARLIPEPVEPLPPMQCAPNLPYYVTRTLNNELPVYREWKDGGSLKLTIVKKIDGDVKVLRDELMGALSLDKKQCVIKPVTNHISCRGHHKEQIVTFLRERLF